MNIENVKKLNEELKHILKEDVEYKWELGNISEIGAYEDYPCLIYGDRDGYYENGTMLISFCLGEEDPDFYSDWETDSKYNFSTAYEDYADGFSGSTLSKALRELNKDENVRKYFPNGVPTPPLEVLKSAIKEYYKNKPDVLKNRQNKQKKESLLNMFKNADFENTRSGSSQFIGGYYSGNSKTPKVTDIVFIKPKTLLKSDILNPFSIISREDIEGKTISLPCGNYCTASIKISELLNNYTPVITGNKVIYKDVNYVSWFIYD